MLNQDVTGARPVDIHAHFFRKPISTCSRKRGRTSMWNIARRRKVLHQDRHLSRPINAYRPHPTHSQAHHDFAVCATYTRCLRCAGAPRRPTSGSKLSLPVPS